MTGARGPEIVFIGDDFTGASDTLATLTRAGRRTRLFLAAHGPAAAAGHSLDAVGVATELRALDPDSITHQLLAMAGAIASAAPRFVHYKVCSTFDSGPSVGSIGAAVRALEAALSPALTVIVGGQPSLRRYCLFGNLFAAAADGAVHRIDRHPVMRVHPTTPMAESDLRRHLAAQGLDGLALLAWTEIGTDGAALADRLSALSAGGTRRVLADVGEAAHLATLGAALRRIGSGRPILLVGASSVAECLAGPAAATEPSPPPVAAGAGPGRGPCLVVAGSRSAVTAAQVTAAVGFDRVRIPPDAISNGGAARRTVAEIAASLRTGRPTLAHLEPDCAYGVTAVALARRLADLVADVVGAVPVGALGVAGGDTSSVIVRRLGFESLSYLDTLDPGVALCAGHMPPGRAGDAWLMLKGGQMGGPDLFDRFARRWAAAS